MSCRSVILAVVWVMAGLSTGARGADCNGNGIDDATDVETASSPDCNGNTVPDECEQALLDFGPRGRGLPLGDAPRAVLAADFDGDGDPDVAAATQGTGRATLSLFLNEGDGSFGGPRAFAMGPAVSDIGHGDLDGDGLTDLVAVADSTLSILYNTGGGRFGPVSTSTVENATNLFGLVVADLDGDGAVDIAATDSRESVVHVFINSGTGSFAEPTSYPVGNTPSKIIAADFDRDGDPDLAATNFRSSSVSLLWNEDGEAGFAAAVEIEIGGRTPRAIASDDFDGDGSSDLAVATLTTVNVLLSSGQGDFQEPAAFATRAAFLIPGDYDRDGDADLAAGVANTNSVEVLLNGGDGSFLAREEFAVGSRNRAGSAADFDGDGDLDLAIAVEGPDQVAILFNGEVNRTVSAIAARFSIGQPPHSADAGDMDGDGDVDFICANGLRGTVSVLLNDGDGGFQLKGHSMRMGYLNTVVVGDVDGDDIADVVTADHESDRVFVLLNDGVGALARPVVYRAGNAPFFATLGDFDRDGALDIVTANEASRNVSVFLNSGAGTFHAASHYPTGGVPWGAAPGDFDGDGHLDIAVANRTGSSIAVLSNLGDATFERTAVFSIRRSPSYVVALDVDLDGDLDLATANWNSRDVSVLLNRGGGSFELAGNYLVGRTAYALESTDMDGDGRPDLVTANRNDNSVSVMVNAGGGSFVQSVHLTAGAEPRFAPVGDLNGDGSVDIVAANHDSDDITVLLNQLPAPFQGNFLEHICTADDFRKVSVPAEGAGPLEREGKYILPARRDDALLPPLFQNTRSFPLHEDFLRKVFRKRFPVLEAEDYDQLVGRRDTRDYYVGSISRVRLETDIVYAFTIVADTGFDLREVLGLDEVRGVYETLRGAFALRPLAYLPNSALARSEAERWETPGFDVLLDDALIEEPSDLEFEAYTQAIGYGRVRLLREDEFREANQAGRFSFQDVLVLDFAPTDIEGVVGGVITAATQGPLSHLAVRTARRGTPNAFVRNAHEAFFSHDGQLVRLEVREDGVDMEAATAEEAQEFWSGNRPVIGDLPLFDADYSRFDDLREIDLTGSDGVPPEARYGGKATNFARLQQILDGPLAQYRESGFAIPMRYYVEFMRRNRMPSFVEPERLVTYEDYILELLAAPDVQTDPELRFEALRQFRELAEQNGRVPLELVVSIAARVGQVFGETQKMVRCRSSSNVEDLLAFSGAGLYDSTSACAADDLDLNESGPSRCDVTRQNERGIARALKRVWVSLWTFRAFEERSFFQIPHENAAMGVLVTRAFPDEESNGVAFTGNPLDPVDRRYMVTVQKGEASVVSPEPGVVAERDFVGVLDGEVVLIARDKRSSLVPRGEEVLSDDQLAELGSVLWRIEERFPADTEGHAREEVLLDFEFKFAADGNLAIKQVRPFLHSVTFPPTPTFALDIASGNPACGVFSVDLPGRTLRQEYESKSSVRFAAGRLELETRRNLFRADLVEELYFGPQGEPAEPQGPGFFQVTRTAGEGDLTVFAYRFQQDFSLADGRSLRLELSSGVEFQARGEVPVDAPLAMDEEFFSSPDARLEARVDGDPVTRFSSCSQDHLPLWKIDAELAGPSAASLRLFERFRPRGVGEDTGPASLVRGEVDLGGARQTVTDYWRLVYRSRRHNLNVQYWVVLDPALPVDGLDRPVAIVELAAPVTDLQGNVTAPAAARYLDGDFEALAELAVTSFRKEPADELPPGEPRFVRGDVTADGAVNVTDAIRLLDQLFGAGAAGPCGKASDANDDGRVNITDAVRILFHLFRGGAYISAPAGACGFDPTPDALACGAFPACP